LDKGLAFLFVFYDQNEDDAIKNMVTVVIEERVTIVAGRADYLYYGDFSDGTCSTGNSISIMVAGRVRFPAMLQKKYERK
jgi:hypothetical protein